MKVNQQSLLPVAIYCFFKLLLLQYPYRQKDWDSSLFNCFKERFFYETQIDFVSIFILALDWSGL